jgi:predicted transcriptional regulator of viral defense system
VLDICQPLCNNDDRKLHLSSDLLMAQYSTAAERILELARQVGIIRVRDLAFYGLHPENLRRLCAQGLLVRTRRGLYTPADAAVTENRSLAEVAKREPSGVVCLLSALQFHGLTTQLPFEVWLAVDRALDRRTRRNKTDRLPLRLVRFSGPAFTFGIEAHRIEGVGVKVYSPAKTVADCFKFRYKIGLDVALEALRDCWKQRRATMDELYEAARVCRVAKVMRPYLESVV